MVFLSKRLANILVVVLCPDSLGIHAGNVFLSGPNGLYARWAIFGHIYAPEDAKRTKTRKMSHLYSLNESQRNLVPGIFRLWLPQSFTGFLVKKFKIQATRPN